MVTIEQKVSCQRAHLVAGNDFLDFEIHELFFPVVCGRVCNEIV